MPGFRDETETNNRREHVFVPQPVVLGQNRDERPVSFLPSCPGLSVLEHLSFLFFPLLFDSPFIDHLCP